MKTTHRLQLVTDATGRIVGMAPAGEPRKGENATLSALPGQTLHEVPLPAELEPLLSGSMAELHRALSAYRLRTGPAHSLLLPNKASPKK
jgi:hypothetical protein